MRDATPLDVIEGRARWCVVTADCLDVLPTLPSGSVAHVITDPPYIIGAKSDGQGKLSPWADWTNAAVYFAAWMREVRRVSRGAFWCFSSWRTLVTLQKAACDLRWPIESLLVWDKDWIGPGGPNGLRPSYELAALWCADDFGLSNRGLPDIVRVPWSSQKPNGHPAEKPEELLRLLVEWSAKPDDVILDPFMGSATCGVSAIRSGCRYIGIELDAAWAETSRERLEAEGRGLTLKDARQGQTSIFDAMGDK